MKPAELARVHEAGHDVVGRALGWRTRRVRIGADGSGMTTQLGRITQRNLLHNSPIIALAGAVAEAIAVKGKRLTRRELSALLDRLAAAGGDDFAEVEATAVAVARRWTLRRMLDAQRILLKRWRSVERARKS